LAIDLTANALLGYPDDARLLIVNADDFGMCHANNEATLRAFKDGIVTSTTLMTTCPWAPHAIQLLREHHEMPFGVHLTLISEHLGYRWGPLAPKDRVPSLLDEGGYFYTNDRRSELLAQAKLDEIEQEFRTQIRTVLNARLTPTHLDFHCLGDGGREDIFDLTLELAKEFGLALRVSDRSSAERCRAEGLPVSDHGVLDSYGLGWDDKSAKYVALLRALPTGLNEWAIHPSLGDAEAQAMEPTSWRVRKADFDFLISREARDIVNEQGITLLDFRALQKIWTR
jgi:chitin disaccharide deacetylase